MINSLFAIGTALLLSSPSPALRMSYRPRKTKLLLIPIVVLGGFVIMHGPGVVASLAMVLAVAVRKVWEGRRQAAREQAATDTASLLGAMAADLEAGATTHEAIAHAATEVAEPLQGVCAIAAHRSAAGMSPAGAFLEAPAVYTELRSAARLWLIAETKGIALSNLLVHVQERIDAHLRHARATDAALQGPKATAVILALLPLGGIAMGSGMGANPIPFLTTTALGQVLLVVGTALACAGFLWVDVIVARASNPRAVT